MKLSLHSSRSSKGKAAEAIACDHLENNGLQLIDKNFNSRYGEIDLIMRHKDSLVFIEVRYRKNLDYGGAMASVTPTKQQKIIKTALYYMQKQGREFNARFDVVAITGATGTPNQQLSIEWIQNAF